MLIKQKAYNIAPKRVISLVIAIAFMANDLAFAVPERFYQDNSTLAIPSQLTEEAFKRRFAAGEFLLSYDGAVKYVSGQLEREKKICEESKIEWKAERAKELDLKKDSHSIRGLKRLDVPGLENIRYIKLTGVMAHTGQFAIVDLTGEFTGYTDMPTMVVDSSFYGMFDNELIRHELDEILQWEDLRVNILKLTAKDKSDMAGWIIASYDGLDERSRGILKETPYKDCLTSQDIARSIHGSSYSLDKLYRYKAKQLGEIGVRAAFNFEEIGALYRYGVEHPSKRVNVGASSGTTSETVKSTERLPDLSGTGIAADSELSARLWIMLGNSHKHTFDEVIRQSGNTPDEIEAVLNTPGNMNLWDNVIPEKVLDRFKTKLDIILAKNGIRDVPPAGQTWRSTAYWETGGVDIYARDPWTGKVISAHFSASKEAVLEHGQKSMEVVIEYIRDPNHGPMIFLYDAEEYDDTSPGKILKRPALLSAYASPSGKSGKGEMTLINPAVLDILKTVKGEKIECPEHAERFAKATIVANGPREAVCQIYCPKPFLDFYKKKTFAVPRIVNGRDLVGKEASIGVEKDALHGQVINIYIFEDEEASAVHRPIATFRFNAATRELEPVDLALLDIALYRKSGPDSPARAAATWRSYTVTIRLKYPSKPDKGYVARVNREGTFDTPICFYLDREDLLQPDGTLASSGEIGVRDDPDYGPYIALVASKGREISRLMKVDGLAEMQTVPFARNALVDYILGMPNVHGNPVDPREYWSDACVVGYGVLNIGNKIRPCKINRLMPLADENGKNGRRPVFVPVKDDRFGWRINVYDAEAYRADRSIQPVVVMVRDPYFKRLIPIETWEFFRAQELADRNMPRTALMRLDMIIAADPKNKEAKAFRTGMLRDAAGDDGKMPYADEEARNIVLLTDALGSGDREAIDFGTAYFAARLRREDRAGLIERLATLTDRSDITESGSMLAAAAFHVMSLLPLEAKTLDLLRRLSKVVLYDSPQDVLIRSEAMAFFRTIPGEFLYQPVSAEEAESWNRDLGSLNDLESHRRYFNEAVRAPLLTAVGETVLISRARLGDDDARKSVLASNLRLVIFRLKKFAWSGLPKEDLFTAGVVGAVKIGGDKGLAKSGLAYCVDLFEPWSGNKFSTYAVKAIDTGMMRHVENNRTTIRVPSHVQEKVGIFLRLCKRPPTAPGGIEASPINPYDMTISNSHIASCIGWMETDVEAIRDVIFQTISSINATYKDGDDAMDPEHTIEGSIGKPDPGLAAYENDDMIEFIRQRVYAAIKKEWPDKAARNIVIFDRRILPRYYGDEPDELRVIGEDPRVNLSHTMVDNIAVEIQKLIIKDEVLVAEVRYYAGGKGARLPVSAASAAPRRIPEFNGSFGDFPEEELDRYAESPSDAKLVTETKDVPDRTWLATDNDGFSFGEFKNILIRPYWNYLIGKRGIEELEDFAGMDGLTVSMERGRYKSLFLVIRPHYRPEAQNRSASVLHRLALDNKSHLMPEANNGQSADLLRISIIQEIEKQGHIRVLAVGPGIEQISARKKLYVMNGVIVRLREHFKAAGEPVPEFMVTRRVVADAAVPAIRLEVREKTDLIDPGADPKNRVFASLDINPDTGNPLNCKEVWNNKHEISFLDTMIEQHPEFSDEYPAVKTVDISKESVGFNNVVYRGIDDYFGYLSGLLDANTQKLKALRFTAKRSEIRIDAVIETTGDDRKTLSEGMLFVENISLDSDGRPKGVECRRVGTSLHVNLSSAVWKQGKAEEIRIYPSTRMFYYGDQAQCYVDDLFCQRTGIDVSGMTAFRYAGTAENPRIEIRKTDKGSFHYKDKPLAVLYLGKDGYPAGLPDDEKGKKAHSLSSFLAAQAELMKGGTLTPPALIEQTLPYDYTISPVEKVVRWSENAGFAIYKTAYSDIGAYMDFLEEYEGISDIRKIAVRWCEEPVGDSVGKVFIKLIPIVKGPGGDDEEVSSPDRIKRIMIDPSTGRPYGFKEGRTGCHILKLLTLPEQGGQVRANDYKRFMSHSPGRPSAEASWFPEDGRKYIRVDSVRFYVSSYYEYIREKLGIKDAAGLKLTMQRGHINIFTISSDGSRSKEPIHRLNLKAGELAKYPAGHILQITLLSELEKQGEPMVLSQNGEGGFYIEKAEYTFGDYIERIMEHGVIHSSDDIMVTRQSLKDGRMALQVRHARSGVEPGRVIDAIEVDDSGMPAGSAAVSGKKSISFLRALFKQDKSAARRYAIVKYIDADKSNINLNNTVIYIKEYIDNLKAEFPDKLKKIKLLITEEDIIIFAILEDRFGAAREERVDALILNKDGLPEGVSVARKNHKNLYYGLFTALVAQGRPRLKAVNDDKEFYIKNIPCGMNSFIDQMNEVNGMGLKKDGIVVTEYSGTASPHRIEIRRKGPVGLLSGELIATLDINEEGYPALASKEAATYELRNLLILQGKIKEERVLGRGQRFLKLNPVGLSSIHLYLAYIGSLGLGDIRTVIVSRTEDSIRFRVRIRTAAGMEERLLHEIMLDDSGMPVNMPETADSSRQISVSLMKLLYMQGQISKDKYSEFAYETIDEKILRRDQIRSLFDPCSYYNPQKYFEFLEFTGCGHFEQMTARRSEAGDSIKLMVKVPVKGGFTENVLNTVRLDPVSGKPLKIDADGKISGVYLQTYYGWLSLLAEQGDIDKDAYARFRESREGSNMRYPTLEAALARAGERLRGENTYTKLINGDWALWHAFIKFNIPFDKAQPKTQIDPAARNWQGLTVDEKLKEADLELLWNKAMDDGDAARTNLIERLRPLIREAIEGNEGLALTRNDFNSEMIDLLVSEGDALIMKRWDEWDRSGNIADFFRNTLVARLNEVKKKYAMEKAGYRKSGESDTEEDDELFTEDNGMETTSGRVVSADMPAVGWHYGGEDDFNLNSTLASPTQLPDDKAAVMDSVFLHGEAELVARRDLQTGLSFVSAEEKRRMAYSLGELINGSGLFRVFENGSGNHWALVMKSNLGVLGSAVKGDSPLELLILTDAGDSDIEEGVKRIAGALNGRLENNGARFPKIVVGRNGDHIRTLELAKKGDGNGNFLGKFVEVLHQYGVGVQKDKGITTIEVVSVNDYRDFLEALLSGSTPNARVFIRALANVPENNGDEALCYEAVFNGIKVAASSGVISGNSEPGLYTAQQDAEDSVIEKMVTYKERFFVKQRNNIEILKAARADAKKPAPGARTRKPPEFKGSFGDFPDDELERYAGGLPEAAPADEAAIPKNIEEALRVMDGIAAKNLDRGEVYTIRYDRRRLAAAGPDAESSALKALEIYVDALKMRAGEKWRDKVKLIGFDSIPCLKDKLISVERYADRAASKPIGSSQIDIEGSLAETPVDVVTILNMAIVACEIPAGASPEEAMRDYRGVLERIEVLYNALSATSFDMNNPIFRMIDLILPSAAKLSSEELRDYYRLTIEALKTFA